MAYDAEKLKRLRDSLRNQKRKLDEAEKLANPSYDRHRDASAAREREKSHVGREIGPLPKVADPERRAACERNPKLYATTYFPARFPLPFATFHDDAFIALESCIQEGGLFFCAMPRGSGKDTLIEVMVIRAVSYGLRRFVAMINATQQHAENSLKKIKAELETNDLLLADFPEVCYPIRKLERINNRARGQRLDGRPTRMEWNSDTLFLPTVQGAASSGAIIKVAGLTGAIRGLTVLGPGGQPLRPDMSVVNDAQTRESAKSPTQTADREAIISDDVLMLAGPDTTMAAVQLGTVIYRNDLNDRYLNQEKHPEWQSVRTKLLTKFPDNMDLWDQYADIRREGQREGDKGKKGNAFYAENREAMDKGGIASWPERKKKGELTGLQSAMNLYIDNRRGFFAEGQNDPEAAELAVGSKELSAELVSKRFNGFERYTIPKDCTRLVCMIDPGKFLHWYTIIGWNEHFGGSVIDYGQWPRQNRQVFEHADARPSLATQYPGLTEEQFVFQGLMDLEAEIMNRTYYSETGEAKQIELCLVDSGYQTEVIGQFIRKSNHEARLRPSKGFGRSRERAGVSEWKQRDGERRGFNWRLTLAMVGKKQTVQFDSDAWKSFLFSALTIPPGGKTGLTFWGKSAGVHEMLGNHCAAEYSEPAEVRGTSFDAWVEKPGKPDNHLFDALVGACVAVSFLGLQWSATGNPEPKKPKGPRKSWVEMQKEQMTARGL